ncbi:MAG: hypothetical protein R3F05_16650 [Planctomycetota bacterium]
MRPVVGTRTLVPVLLMLFLSACGKPDAEGARTLVGAWESKTFLSQLGPGVLRYAFHADGRFEMEQRLEALPSAPLGAKGTWRLKARASSTTTS